MWTIAKYLDVKTQIYERAFYSTIIAINVVQENNVGWFVWMLLSQWHNSDEVDNS